MVRNVGAPVEPVANPSLRPAKRERLVRMAKAQLAYNIGPVRQTRHQDEVVSPLALERECGILLYRAQRAIATVVTSQVFHRELRGTVQERALRQHEWDIAVALREITERLLDLVANAGGSRASFSSVVSLRGMLSRACPPTSITRPSNWRSSSFIL